MSIAIPDEVLATTCLMEGEMKQEIVVMLF